MNSEHPESYPRRVLLAVTGLSPQVATETLYALAVRRERSFIPTEMHVLTTKEGAMRARLALLSEDPGWFPRLLRDYKLPAIRFDESHVHAISGADGVAFHDIRTVEENEYAADFITEQVRRFTADQHAALHVSIAGGRKTMGYYLGYALSLFGRAQDRLSHVLVSEPFESSWDFFYPTPYSRVITTRDNKLIDTADARVTLAEIPFVSLRHGLPEHLLRGHASYSESVAAARAGIGPAELVLDLPAGRAEAGGRRFTLPPAEMALLAVFARVAGERGASLNAPPKDVGDPAWAERYLAELRTIADVHRDLQRTERALRNGMDGGYFSMRLSKLRKALLAALGAGAAPYLIEDGGKRPRRYRLALPPEAVRFGQISG